MAHLICPAREELHSLRTPLTTGELQVLEFFDRYLPGGWEIYVQPHLNELRFVLLHPQLGIAVFEVKDWNLDAMPYLVREINGVPSLWSWDQLGQEFRQGLKPLSMAGATYGTGRLDATVVLCGRAYRNRPLH
jgi:hypothetical protein